MAVKNNILRQLSQEKLLVDETLLSTANGYIGIRGNFEEGYSEGMKTIRGTYINGFYGTYDMTYGENAYGFPDKGQKMINVIDVQGIELWLGKERFSLFDGEVLLIERKLNIDSGYAVRKVLWRSPFGHEIELTVKRMASFEKPELFIIDYGVRSINYNGPITLKSKVDGNVINYRGEGDPRVASDHSHLLLVKKMDVEDELITIQAEAKGSGLSMSVAVTHSLPMTHEIVDMAMVSSYKSKIKSGKAIRLIKYAVFTDSVRHGHSNVIAKTYINEAVERGIEQWYRAQKDYLNRFWKISRVHVYEAEMVEEALNYSIYQLLASAGKDGYSSVAAKGLSGEGYEGHYFWDTEIYMMPFFTLTDKETARSLMQFRYNTLGASRKRARILGHSKGVKFAWRTISGSECSGYFPAGTAQYHINADIAYSFLQYWFASDDAYFMIDYGAEVILESARLWLEAGNYDDLGRFVINAVTGPDEYTAIVNNNYYTNAMARYHLAGTLRVLNWMKEAYSRDYRVFCERMSLTKEEVTAMEQAMACMFLPYDDRLGIDLQDDSFLQKPVWDFEDTGEEKYPLLLHYHPLTIYRHRVLKQADTVLAHMLLDDRDDLVLSNSFHYYEKYTTHDSSLSPCVHSIMAARIGEVEKAYNYFMQTLRLDLDNLHDNTRDGLHIANAGGAYMALVYGFGGLRIKAEGITLRPALPKDWKGYSFSFQIKGILVEVTVKDRILIKASEPIRLTVYDRIYRISNIIEVHLI